MALQRVLAIKQATPAPAAIFVQILMRVMKVAQARLADPIFKYLSIDGARLTLGNRCFKHAKPSTFNDTEDLTIRSIFPEDDERALAIIENGFTDLLLAHLDDEPTCLNERMRLQVKTLLIAFKANPDAASIVKEAKAKLPSVFDLEKMKAKNLQFLAEVNAFMQGYRVLCVSLRNDSERMWGRYAEDSQGIVLHVTPNVAKDSKFQLFRPVTYEPARPTLYSSAAQFQEDSLFGDQTERIAGYLSKIIFTKTREWAYENELRLAIPVLSEADWDTLAFHPEEITGLYLGAKADKTWREEVIALGRAINPEIAVFEMFHDAAGSLRSRIFRE